MSKLRTNQLETLDGLNTVNVSDIVDDIDTASVTTSTGTQTLGQSLDRRVIYVESYPNMKALSVTALTPNQPASVTTTGRAGNFVWKPGDQSANILSDPQEGIWVAPASDTTGASGAWMRRYNLFAGEWMAGWFGYVADYSDQKVSIQAAIDYAAQFSGTGAWVSLPPGVGRIEDTITLPNRIGLRGPNGRGARIEASDNFPVTANEMFHASNGTTSMFGSKIADLEINMRGRGSSTARCIWAQAWQETCGLERVAMRGFNKYALELTDGFGGAAYLPLRDIEIFGGGDATTPTAGIRVQQISLNGSFVLSVDGATITGTPGGHQMPAGISMVNDTLIARGLHFEHMTDGAVASGLGSISVDTATGSSNGIINSIITFGTGFAGSASLKNIIPNGATNSIRDLRSGRDTTGLVTEYKSGYEVSEATPKAWALLNGATGGVIKSFNVSGSVRNSIGNYVVSFDRPMLDSDYAVLANHSATTQRLPLVRENSKSATSYAFSTLEWSGSAAADAVLVDANSIYIAFYSSD